MLLTPAPNDAFEKLRKAASDVIIVQKVINLHPPCAVAH